VLPSDGFALAVLSAAAVGVYLVSGRYSRWVPTSALVVLVLLAGATLRLRSLLVFYAIGGVLLAAMFVRWGEQAVSPGLVGVLVGTAVLVLLLYARPRARLGLAGTRGESMLVDLRDRLRAQGELPALPEGWQADVVQHSAGGASFSGDFVVAYRSQDGRLLELALVDVSGKGVAAGTRALLLAGAFGGLLGAVARPDFLRAANTYLYRQQWEEGFATAVHLAVDLDTGDYWITSAGHPPALLFDAGSGRWRTASASGPLLGILPEARYVAEPGRLERGDALLLYTDGLVEKPGRDLSLGIDRLLGEAERLVTRGFRPGARELVQQVDAGEADDRALVLLWRS
ncbi:MAG: serine/threonine-protein phosphatase, partial [Actinomycetota bacterium]|nr:serine/threonine-protein phosphatase [Actinomycetota bacterium]